MVGVGFGFGAGLDGEFDGGGAAAESVDLREDEPHPVGLFLASAEFVEDIGVDGGLGVQEALEIVWVGGHGLIVRGAFVLGNVESKPAP